MPARWCCSRPAGIHGDAVQAVVLIVKARVESQQALSERCALSLDEFWRRAPSSGKDGINQQTANVHRIDGDLSHGEQIGGLTKFGTVTCGIPERADATARGRSKGLIGPLSGKMLVGNPPESQIKFFRPGKSCTNRAMSANGC